MYKNICKYEGNEEIPISVPYRVYIAEISIIKHLIQNSCRHYDILDKDHFWEGHCEKDSKANGLVFLSFGFFKTSIICYFFSLLSCLFPFATALKGQEMLFLKK